MLIVAMAAPLLGGCLDNGSTADPPTAFTAAAGDGRVMLTWTGSPGVDYWLFTATDPGLTAFNWTGLPNAHAYIKVATPYYMCGLFDNSTYYFAMNGRKNGGPGGASSPTINSTPYNASAAAWTAGTTPSSPNLYGVGYTGLTTCSNNSTSAAGSFAAVGAGGAIFTSPDGINWTNQTTPSGFTTDLYAVTGYAANQNNPGNPARRWVAVGAGGASIYSLDGISWAVGNPFNSGSTANPSNQALRSITQVAGTYFAVGDTGTILSSTDGITWTTHVSGTPNNLNGVAHGTVYVAVGNSGTILTSGDGNTWTAHTSTPAVASILREVAAYGSIIVAVGDAGTIVTSIDSGASWTLATLPGTPTPTPNLVGVAAEPQYVYGATADPQLGYVSTAQFVAIDDAGKAYTSVNGITWSGAINTGIAANPGNLGKPMVSSGFGYVAVGNTGATAYAF